jgi:predicted nucleic acid-binding protein
MTDLLIATLADAHDVTLIHYDADFEIAAEILPFRHQWVLERGTI